MNYLKAGPSLAHTYGNVTAFYTEYIKGLFPKNYFKTVHISSTIAFREFNILKNKNREFFKKSKPMLIVRPRVEFNASDEFLKGSYLTSRIANTISDIDFGNLHDMINDEEKGSHIKYLLNRMTMMFDVSVIVETQMEQLNTATALKNIAMLERPFDIETCLENQIPRDILELMSKDIDVPMYGEDGSVQEFLNHINTNATYPITYKMKNSTGNDEFFRYYPALLDTTISELSLDDGSKKGFLFDAFTINFTVSSEFYIAGMFYYFTKNPKTIDGVQISIATDDKIIPVYTVNNLFDVELPLGWNLYSTPMYRVESNKYTDEMEISSLFNTSLTEMIKYHKANGIPIETFLNIVVMQDNTKLINIEHYRIDYDDMMLYTIKTNTTSTYRIIIHVNTLYVNNLISNVYGFFDEK